MSSALSTPTDTLPPKSCTLRLSRPSAPQQSPQFSHSTPTPATSRESPSQPPSPSAQPETTEYLLASSQEMFLPLHQANSTPQPNIRDFNLALTTPNNLQLSPEQHDRVKGNRQQAYRLRNKLILREIEERRQALKAAQPTFASSPRISSQ